MPDSDFEEVYTPTGFKTNDLGLAAFLTLNGHSCQGNEWQGGTCYWQFILLASLNELVEQWVNQTALVEPVAYNRAFYQLKRGLLSTLHPR